MCISSIWLQLASTCEAQTIDMAQTRVQNEAENMLTSLEKDKVRPMQVS
jgi:hypothetical protein